MRSREYSRWVDPAPLEVTRPRLPWWTMLPRTFLLAASPIIALILAGWLLVAYTWVTKPDGKRQRKYVYGQTREEVHDKWLKLPNEARKGPVATKVPKLGEFLTYWLDEIVKPNLAPLTYATYETFVRLEELITRNVASSVKVPSARKRVRKVQAWSSEEARRFLESARSDNDPLYAAYVLILVLGLREG